MAIIFLPKRRKAVYIFLFYFNQSLHNKRKAVLKNAAHFISPASIKIFKNLTSNLLLTQPLTGLEAAVRVSDFLQP
jgi:hypothetical protein